MKRLRHDSIASRIANLCVAFALLFSLLASSLQGYWHLNDYNRHIHQAAEQLLDTAQALMILSLDSHDSALTDTSLDTLINSSAIIRAQLQTPERLLVSEQVTPLPDSSTRWLTRLINGSDTRQFERQLTTPQGEPLGFVTITLDLDQAQQDLRNTIVYVYYTDVILNLFIALALIAIVYHTVSRPLKKLSFQIGNINPRATSNRLIQVSSHNEHNEVGRLAKLGNQLIKTLGQFANEQNDILQQLQERDKLLTQTGQIAQVGGWKYDPESRYFICSEEFCEIYGFPKNQPVSYSEIQQRAHPNDRNYIEQEINKAQANNTLLDIQFRIVIGHKVKWIHSVAQLSSFQGKAIIQEGIIQDISKLKAAEDTMQLQDFALSKSPAAIITLNEQGDFVSANETAVRLYGYSQEEFMQLNTLDTVANLTPEKWQRWWQKLQQAGELITEVNHIKKDGSVFPVEITSGYFTYSDQPLCVMSAQDITERKRYEAEIKHLAYHDHLTGLPNRSLMKDRLDQAIALATRNQNAGALLFIDLDNFKPINDNVGHHAGDLVLKEIAQRLLSHLRDSDTVARIGGDEFIVIAQELGQNPSEAVTRAKDLANKLLTLITRPISYESRELRVSASIGVIAFSKQSQSAVELIQFADSAMYQAKAKGRSTISVFNPQMAKQASRMNSLEAQLETALTNQEFHLSLQPIMESSNSQNQQFDAQHTHMVGAEVLLRWNNKSFGQVVPAESIPLIEKSGKINEVGFWILQQSMQQVSEWLQQGRWQPGWFLSINISMTQLLHDDFIPQLQELMLLYPLPEKSLHFEFSEPSLVDHLEHITEKLQTIQGLGIAITIDDFGTGLASLTSFKNLTVDNLKIDGSLINNAPHQANSVRMINSIIQMANQLGTNVIAEQIEHTLQAKFLKQQGCEQFQGFLFEKPIAMHLFENYLDKQEESEPSLQQAP